MITNAVCRVFRSSSVGLVCVGEHPCMKQEVKAAEVKKYGEERADSAAVYIPDLSADVMKGDFLFFGIGEPTEKEIYAALRVVSVTKYDYGSENMRHIKLGAKG